MRSMKAPTAGASIVAHSARTSEKSEAEQCARVDGGDEQDAAELEAVVAPGGQEMAVMWKWREKK